MPTQAISRGGSETTSRPPNRGRGDGGHRLAAAFEQVERFPALAESRRRVIRLASNAIPSVTEIIDVIESDPALTLAVMRAANGAGHAPRGSVYGVPQAVDVLGTEELVALTEGLQTYEFFEQGNGWRTLPDRFRGHAVATRAAVERVAELARLPSRDELVVAALLHDIGKLVLSRLHPSYEWPGPHATVTPEARMHAETRELGIDHALVGGVLARRWGIPDRIARAIERHHSVDAAQMAAAVRLADMVAHHAHGGSVASASVSEAAEALGLSNAKARKVFYEYPYVHTPRKRVSEPCPLSARELDALRGLADGKVYKEIAGEMSLSASTVRTHLHNVYRKIGAVDRAQAVLLARDRGWL